MTDSEYLPTHHLSSESYSLATKRLTLKLIAEDQLPVLHKLMADPAITTYLTWSPHTSPEATRAVIRSLISAREQDKGVTWVIYHGKQVCGLVSLIDIRRRHRLWLINRAELSYWLTPSWQGKGLMTEACRAVLDFAFNTLRFHKIIVAHAQKNDRSKNLISRLGFQETGRESFAFCKNNIWHDLIHYQQLNPQLLVREERNAQSFQ